MHSASHFAFLRVSMMHRAWVHRANGEPRAWVFFLTGMLSTALCAWPVMLATAPWPWALLATVVVGTMSALFYRPDEDVRDALAWFAPVRAATPTHVAESAAAWREHDRWMGACCDRQAALDARHAQDEQVRQARVEWLRQEERRAHEQQVRAEAARRVPTPRESDEFARPPAHCTRYGRRRHNQTDS